MLPSTPSEPTNNNFSSSTPTQPHNDMHMMNKHQASIKYQAVRLNPKEHNKCVSFSMDNIKFRKIPNRFDTKTPTYKDVLLQTKTSLENKKISNDTDNSRKKWGTLTSLTAKT